MPLALSTGHEVGLGVTALVFIVFALASSFLLPRFRSDYPGRGLLAFIVVAFVFFFGMLTAVEVFGSEDKHGEAAAAETTAAETTTAEQTTTAAETTTAETTTKAETTAEAKPEETKVPVTETEFKIALGSTNFKAGEITFEAKNDGKIPHDLAIKGVGDKTKEIGPGQTDDLKITLKPGKYELYCTIPGHEQAGMKQTVTVS
ncbi:MAG: cupredoxin domain-containing protein [Actinobacteria bacterium]|nr:cupredoxin domain-containing protein [Actinomycetota bacterium]